MIKFYVILGQKIAKFVLDAKIPPEKIHMVGHSLGAHIAGFAAKQIYQEAGERVSRISGLDPAGPYFQEHILDKDERLDREDADVVNVIHTDAGETENNFIFYCLKSCYMQTLGGLLTSHE